MVSPTPAAAGGLPWKTLVRGLLGLLFVAAMIFTVVAFAYAYPYCRGPRMTNCGIGPALALFASLVSSGAALVIGVLLLLLWQASPMSLALQRTCQLFTGASAIYLIGCLVIVNL